MIWMLTIGWLVWGFIMYKLGWQTGIGDGTWVCLKELQRQKIIHIDKKTEAISPGTASKQTLRQVANKIGDE